MELTARYIATLHEHKEELLSRWIARDDIQKLLKRFHIHPGFFKVHFANRMFECSCDTILDNRSEREYPIIAVFMIFFHFEKVSYSDMAILYESLRREFLRELINDHQFDPLFDAVNDAFNSNISYIIEEITRHNSAARCPKDMPESLPGVRLDDVVTSVEVHFEQEDLDDLQDFEGMLLESFDASQALNETMVEKLSQVLDQYARLLSNDVNFLKLSDAFLLSSQTIATCDVNAIQDEQSRMIQEYIVILADELSHWRVSLAEGTVVEDSKSLISNLEFLTRLFQPQSAVPESEDLEWF